MRLETGKVARQSNGSVMVTYGETVILAAVNASKEPREGIDYFPLQVEYREKHYAGGKIPGGFFKREARPAEHEVLTSRLTDRPIRPLFPKGFKNEVQVMITVLQSDGENMADTLSGVGASAALITSTIPWNGPIATVRVGRIDGEFVINPTRTDLLDSDMEMIVSGNQETVVMVEGEAEEATESEILDALKHAHGTIKEIIELQNELLSEMDVQKDEFVLEPNHFVLASTAEYIRVPHDMAAYVEGRSSIGRLGLQVQNAGFIDAGFNGQITLELENQSGFPVVLKKVSGFVRLSLSK